MEVLYNSSTTSRICRKYYVDSFAPFKWRNVFIARGTATVDHGRFADEVSPLRR